MENTTKKKRDKTIDILKGTGIVLMVAGHSGVPFTNFVYLFHMAIFFIASGYCYNNRKSENLQSVWKNCFGKMKSLWLPYMFWMMLFSLVHNFFVTINVYTNDERLYEYSQGEYVSTIPYWGRNEIMVNIKNALVLRGESQIGGALWFVAVLLEISIVYCIIDFVIRKCMKGTLVWIAQGVLAICLLLVGYYCHKTGMTILGLSKMCSYYCLFYIGNLIKSLNLYEKKRNGIIHVGVFVVCFCILIISTHYGSIALASNSYVNPIFLLIVSFSGWQWIYELSWMIKKLQYTSSVMICFGQNTLMIVILHFLCFKLVNYIGAMFNQWPLCSVAAFPTLFKGGVWWIAYTVTGVIIPVGISLIWKKIISELKIK